MHSLQQHACKKNYYTIETLSNCIKSQQTVSFNLVDTLILENFLLPDDIIKILSDYTTSVLNIPQFYYIRKNVELELRSNNQNEPVSAEQIYGTIHTRMPEVPCDVILQKEQELWLSYICRNPLASELYRVAQEAQKNIVIFSNCQYDTKTVEKALEQSGYRSKHTVLSSNWQGANKRNGKIYRHAQEILNLSPSGWIHIGDNAVEDLDIPRNLGIKAARIKSPKQWFVENFLRQEKYQGFSLEDVFFDVEQSISQASAINVDLAAKIVPESSDMVKASDIGMLFRLSNEKVNSIKEFFIKKTSGNLATQNFWALENIDFTLKKGEKLGLIGLNGCGKSTLLKIVAGVLKPTKGTIGIFGSVSPLIELGAGFDQELSARENIFLNGAILGYSHQEMEIQYQGILDFAELNSFADVAIKNYSSGMIARLGFAIATCHKPDILIIDEILAVGDVTFQNKCHKKMKELTDGGTTVLFVSHSPTDVVNLCDKVIWLENGHKIAEGEAEFVVSQYLSSTQRSTI